MPVYKKISKTGKVTWYAIFYYKDWNGTKKQKKKEGFATRRDALAYERDFLERRAAAPSMTFAALVDIYLADCKHRNRPTTYAPKALMVNKHILPYFKDRPINEITPAMVRNWQNTLLARDEYASAYLRTIHATLAAIFNFAQKYHRLPTNPATMAGPMGKLKPRAISFWTLAQFKQFQQAAHGHEPYYTLFTLLFYTGLRIGEALALTPPDIDRAACTLSVTKTYKRLDKQDVIQPPKTEKSSRVIALPPFLVDILMAYMDKLPGLKPTHRLFEGVTVWSVARALKKYSGDLPRIRVHDLRHSHASLLIEQGFSPLAIRDRLGHEDIQTTLNTYSHLYPHKQEEISARLQALAADEQHGE